MAEYKAVIVWHRNGAEFTDNRYNRGHVWQLDGGIELSQRSGGHHGQGRCGKTGDDPSHLAANGHVCPRALAYPKRA